MSDARSTPMYCPYCGEENLFPNESSHGAWECHSCTRVFTVKFNGLLAAQIRPSKTSQTPAKGVSR